MYFPCSEEKATHVQVVADKHKHYELAGVKPGYYYPVKRDNEGTPSLMVKSGKWLEDFELYLEVKWVKHINVQ